MDFSEFSRTIAARMVDDGDELESRRGSIDLSRAAQIEVDRDLYGEADSRGMTLTELLESEEYDPSGPGSALDAFERQLALAGIRIGGKAPTTVEQFMQQASSLMPEFMRREIRKGMSMRPELSRLIANTTTVASNSYTPFYIDTENDSRFSLRPVGDGAEVPQLLVTEQNHAVKVTDYGLALKASYKALRYRTTSQFRVLLWYIGFKLQTDKIAMLVDVAINGDGNGNPARIIDSAASGSLTYEDLISLWAEFTPFELNTLICNVNSLKTILAMPEFKDPLAGYRFSKTGELFSPLGASLVRSDEVPADIVIGLDSRFAIEEVVTQPLMVEYDKIIEQRFEEAVITESVAYAKVIAAASVLLDTVHA